MLDKIEKYIRKWNMIEASDRVVVGLSGGADSVCLLHVLKELSSKIGFELLAVHVEHGIRGEEAKRDQIFSEDLCKKLQIPSFSYSYRVEEIAKARKCSVEEVGRQIRYETFEKVLQEQKGTKIAVAHNKNDSAETVLLNLCRGSGLKGLSGIPPTRATVIRPLLTVSRAEIEEYLEKRNIAYCTDSTNLEEAYTRNKIRRKVLPYLEKEINEQAMSHIVEASIYISEAEMFLQKKARECFEKCQKAEEHQICLLCEPLLSEDDIIKKYVIREGIAKIADSLRDISGVHVEECVALLEKAVGKQIILPGNIVISRGYEELIISRGFLKTDLKKKEVLETLKICDLMGEYPNPLGAGTVRFSIENRQNSENIVEKGYTKWFDYDKIKDNLQLRSRKAGDYITINESYGKQKIKNYFIDHKIPKEEREQVLLLADGSHILWIVGYRISEAYKVSDATKKVLKVQINGGTEDER